MKADVQAVFILCTGIVSEPSLLPLCPVQPLLVILRRKAIRFYVRRKTLHHSHHHRHLLIN